MNPSSPPPPSRASGGDLARFDGLVRQFEAPLVRFVAALLRGDVHAANDVVQDVLVATWQSLPNLKDHDHLAAWLYRVAYRKAVSWRRRRGPNGTPFLDIAGIRLPLLLGPRPRVVGLAQAAAGRTEKDEGCRAIRVGRRKHDRDRSRGVHTEERYPLGADYVHYREVVRHPRLDRWQSLDA